MDAGELKEKLIIYFADLDYFLPGNRNSVPLGIGSIASYCKSLYGDSIRISLFKDPNELIKKIRECPPHILGCSFYMWNTNITFKMIEACKAIDNQTITVIGGPNTARNSDKFKKILIRYRSLDIIVLDQGEKSFSNIVDRVLESRVSRTRIFSRGIDGCALRLNDSGEIIRGKIVDGRLDINKFPSPYLAGYFDQFLEAGFLPSFETVRGCPHQCTFCGGGINSFMPLAVKDEKTVYAEILYILEKSRTKELDIVDTNLGIMGERDLRIISFMSDLYKKTGFPRIVACATTKYKTKTSNTLMIKLAQMMGFLYFALQTLTEEVLNSCKRKNIPFETVKELVAISKKHNWPIAVDTIFGLPGETLKSFMKTIDKILSLGIEAPLVYQLRLLPGTTIAEYERKKYGYKSKFRPISGRYGEYDLFSDKKPVRIIETEEIACSSNDFDFKDYLTIRNFGLITRLLLGSGAFLDTVFYLFSKNIKLTDIFQIIQQNYQLYPRLKKLFDDYEHFSRNELFDSEEDVDNQIAKDDRRWTDLLANKGYFFKLELGFVGYCLFEDIKVLADIENIIFNGLRGCLSSEDAENLKEVFRHDKLYRIIQDKPPGKLEAAKIKREVIVDEIFDYERWRESNFDGNIKNYQVESPVRRTYYIEKFDLLKTRLNEFSGLSGYLFYEKILLWGPQSLRRLCSVVS